MRRESTDRPRAGMRRTLWAALCLVALVPVAAQAQQGNRVIVGNDRGGLIGVRAAEIRQIRALGQSVEIRGNICYSTCTMYLAAENLCVDPRTTFGFHGPSRYGAPLPPDQFEMWSEVIARHYNAPLRDWFMRDARYARNDILRISGSQIIRLGYASC